MNKKKDSMNKMQNKMPNMMQVAADFLRYGTVTTFIQGVVYMQHLLLEDPATVAGYQQVAELLLLALVAFDLARSAPKKTWRLTMPIVGILAFVCYSDNPLSAAFDPRDFVESSIRVRLMYVIGAFGFLTKMVLSLRHDNAAEDSALDHQRDAEQMDEQVAKPIVPARPLRMNLRPKANTRKTPNAKKARSRTPKGSKNQTTASTARATTVELSPTLGHEWSQTMARVSKTCWSTVSKLWGSISQTVGHDWLFWLRYLLVQLVNITLVIYSNVSR